jgi:predicted nucleic acid-binding Zn ribbon protein
MAEPEDSGEPEDRGSGEPEDRGSGRGEPGGRDRLSLAQEALAAARAQAHAKGLRPTGSRQRQPSLAAPVETDPPPVDAQHQAVADHTSPEPDFVPPQDIPDGRDGTDGAPGNSRRGEPLRRGQPLRRVRRDDPQPLDAAIKGLLDSEGWTIAAATGSVFGRWAQIVGPELAEHTQPEALRDGELTVIADSTAWATQLRLLAAQLVRRLNAELGTGAVQRVKVRGPVTATRRPGEWRVRGSRGPRDTYG